ncbi:HNH endonuclease [Burkholderia aenigmatica]|uniref:HNH endonuclease n=1 Tax=Burkholderia aenigmatica TaxID=2015348 RepID=UPI001581CCAA|nr:hypothetical protein [Burkholderia aenigmatica]
MTIHRKNLRFPVEILNKATPEFIWSAVQQLQRGNSNNRFFPSTDYDLIAENGARLPPKAVFGIALAMALHDVEVLPKHFTAGEGSPCFRLLREAGYQIISKKHPTPPDYQGVKFSREWNEGEVKLAHHLKRERASSLAKAKKSQFIRLHGKLVCQHCNFDPVSHYGTELAEACIEVHHSVTPVADMRKEGHKSTLDDLQCLCANCHRLIHRILRQSKQSE